MGSAASWLHTRVHFAIGWKGDPRPRKAGSKLLLWQAASIALVKSPNKFSRFPCGVTIWFAEDLIVMSRLEACCCCIHFHPELEFICLQKEDSTA